MADIDLNAHPSKVTVTPAESPAETTHRLEQARLDAAHRRVRDMTLFCFAVVCAAGALGLCAWTIVVGPDEGRRWAVPIFSSALAALVGFMVKSKT